MGLSSLIEAAKDGDLERVDIPAGSGKGNDGNSVMDRATARAVVTKTEGNEDFEIPEDVIMDAPIYDKGQDGIYRTEEQEAEAGFDTGDYQKDDDVDDMFDGVDVGHDPELQEMGRAMRRSTDGGRRPNLIAAFNEMRNEKQQILDAADSYPLPEDAPDMDEDGRVAARDTEDINEILDNAQDNSEEFPIVLSNGFRVWARVSNDLQDIMNLGTKATKLANAAKKKPFSCPKTWLPYTKSMNAELIRAAILISMVVQRPKITVADALRMARTRGAIFTEIMTPIMKRLNGNNAEGPDDVEDEKNS